MHSDRFAVRSLGLVLAVPLCLASVGCSTYRGALVQSSNSAAVAPANGTVEVRPAVLVQNGATPAISTVQPHQTANVANLPPLPNDSAPTQIKALSADEKARLIAELEALARDPAGGSPVKADCKPAPTSNAGVAQTASSVASCSDAPKPALRP